MMQELGYCSGIENYSRLIADRRPGSPPMTLLDYFPKDFLLFIDESHVTLPQVHAMYNGDRARKTSLIDFGLKNLKKGYISGYMFLQRRELMRGNVLDRLLSSLSGQPDCLIRKYSSGRSRDR